MSGNIEDIFDGMPKEEVDNSTPDPEPTKSEPDKEQHGDNKVVDELVEGTTPQAKESQPPADKGDKDSDLAKAALEATAQYDPAVSGVIKDLQDERAKRRESDERAIRAEAERDALRKQLDGKSKETTPKKPTTVQDLIDSGRIEPGDAVPAELWAELERNRAEEQQNKKEKTQQDDEDSKKSDFLKKAEKSELVVREEFAIGKAPAGLDYETVIEKGKHNLSNKDQRDIVNSDDPCRTLYEKCIARTPELSALKATAKPSEKQDTSKDKNNPQNTTPIKKPKDQPIPTEGASSKEELEQKAADLEDFFETEMEKSDDQQLSEIRQLMAQPG